MNRKFSEEFIFNEEDTYIFQNLSPEMQKRIIEQFEYKQSRIDNTVFISGILVKQNGIEVIFSSGNFFLF